MKSYTSFTYIFCAFHMFISKSYSFNETINLHKDDLIARVVNGWPANLGDVPYQVAFKRSVRWPRNRYATYCGGIIIAPAKLLSAAHCFTEKPTMCDKICGGAGNVKKLALSHTYAVAGQLWNSVLYHYRDSPEVGQWRRLKLVKYPPKYSFPKLDIALVFLHKPFNYDSYVNSIPYASQLLDYDGKCLVSGFGRKSGGMNSDRLLLAHLTLIPIRVCNRMHRRNMLHFVCTSSQYTDVGKGDSGGPLVCANTGDPNDRGKGVLNIRKVSSPLLYGDIQQVHGKLLFRWKPKAFYFRRPHEFSSNGCPWVKQNVGLNKCPGQLLVVKLNTPLENVMEKPHTLRSILPPLYYCSGKNETKVIMHRNFDTYWLYSE